MQDTYERVCVLLAGRMQISREVIKPRTSLRTDLGMDSLDITDFALEIEDVFEVCIPDEREAGFATVAGVVRIILNSSETLAPMVLPEPVRVIRHR